MFLYIESHLKSIKKKIQARISQEQEDNAHTCSIEGSRIINIAKLQQYINELTAHTTQCGGGIVLTGEMKEGLASILSSRCTKCGHEVVLCTSQKVKGPNGYQRWECNLAAVWGQMATGGGHAQTMSVVGVPVMAKKTFMQTEKDIGEFWHQRLTEAMVEAGRQEKRLAEENQEFHEGVPAITVIVDGGWSKRSHRHSYNAKSGVAIIIGKRTGKLLHIGIRNKYCTACAQGVPKQKHDCYKNWNQSSSQMETDIILEGFQQAEKMHGLRYTQFVGDGDSSVYPTLIGGVAGWGRSIKKQECANHACKCYRGGLEALVQENPAYKGKGGLTQKMRKRLTSAARCAIKMHSKNLDVNKAVKLLERDLINGPYHCFGHHENCSADFCTTARDRMTQATQPMSNDEDDSTDDASSNADLDEVQSTALNQERLWHETLADDVATASDCRRGGQIATEIDPKLMHDIQVLLSRLVAKARQLIGNFTTNLAETWMHIRCKFDGGKVINRSQAGSWEYRCYGAGLQQNLGKMWSPTAWQDMTGSPPNKIHSDQAESTARKVEKDRKRKMTDEAKEKRRQSKYSRLDDSDAARKAYSRHDDGIQPDDVTDDVPPEHLVELKDSYYSTKVIVTREEAEDIEMDTRDQSNSDLWKAERLKRITASKVGAVAKMMKKTKRSTKVKDMIYSTFRGNEATRYGTRMEDTARQKYITYQQERGHPNLTISKAGLVVSLDNPWLAASPDDRVTDADDPQPLGLVEYKNPFAARQLTLSEACNKSTFCLQKRETDGKATYKLKQRHDYYYQVQCQLYCDNKEWCDFVVRTEKELHIERIYRNRGWWEEQIPKLRQFYFDALLPELACPRHNKGGIREPMIC